MTEEVIEQYVTTPQNDLQQIHQVSREYESEPARGVAHGLQKDAIQNGVGARIPHSSEPTSYKDWAFTFRLFKIGDKYTLSFWDSGTTGLTGEILAKDEISKWSAEGRLTADQKLSRFLTRFDSGGNVGPGSFGRGKLIFQAASKSYAIVCDSLRYDDKKYVAFERKLEHNQLIQTAIPHQADAAKGFIERICRGTLGPLEGPGTRITVLDLKEEVVEAFKNSFRDDRPEIANDYSSSFIKMIEETWWEIISKFRVKISLEFEGRTKQVQINEPLKSLVNARDRENGWRVYRRSNMEVIVQNKTYKIKELVIALSPNPLNEDLRGIWIQRKRMKVGLVKNIFPHPTVSKKILGYVILDRDLEDEVEKSEGTTHYSFNFRHSAPSQIRQFVETNLQKFQEELGIRTLGDSKMAKQNMLEAMKEINEMSRKLGLISPYDVGTEFKVEISIESFALPHGGSKRVEFGDSIGPISYKLTNHTQNLEKLELVVNAVQKDTQKSIFSKRLNLAPERTEDIECPEFQLDREDFRNGAAILIVAKVISRSSGDTLRQVTRTLWLGMDEPESAEPFTLIAYKPIFPRDKSTRVEITELIRNLRFKISNNTSHDVKLNVDLVARRSPGSASGEAILANLLSHRDFLLPAMSDKEFFKDVLDVSGPNFIAVNDGPANFEDRKCEIFFSARLSDHAPQLNMVKGENIGKRKIDFYVGIDPPGESIFKNVGDWNDARDPKRSKRQGDRASGYTFLLNVGHPSYKFVESYASEELKTAYIRDQMLVQAYAIAVSEGEYGGIARKYKDKLTDADISPADAFLVMEEMVGDAVLELE